MSRHKAVFANYAPSADSIRREWQGASERFNPRASEVQLVQVNPFPWLSVTVAACFIVGAALVAMVL